MNNYFPKVLDNLHYVLLRSLRLIYNSSAKDYYIRKKLADYYFTRLIPDFLYNTQLSSNYYPTIIAARMTISTLFLVLFGWYIFSTRHSDNSSRIKKYPFGIYTKKYLEYERELILFEKSSKQALRLI